MSNPTYQSVGQTVVHEEPTSRGFRVNQSSNEGTTFYQSYTGPVHQEPQSQGVRINPNAGETTTVTVRKGQPTTTEHQNSGRITAAEINPHHGDGTVFSTARSLHSLGVQQITPETLITINGVQSSVKFFEANGFVHQAADGSWAEGPSEAFESQQSAQEEAPQAAPTDDDLSMPSEVAAAVDQALDRVSDHHIAPLVGIGVGVATGDVERSSLVHRMQQYAGVSPQEAEARVSLVLAAYQQQADAAITQRCGLSPEELPGFYSWARAQHKGQLRTAAEKQIHSNNFSGWRELTDRYYADNAPSLSAVQAAGIETRQLGDAPEVFLKGKWLTLGAAAKLGWL